MRVAVSFLSSAEGDMTCERIKENLPRLEGAGVDTIHWDLMDGVYNSVNTLRFFDSGMMRTVMASTSLDSEAHMMVSDPLVFLDSIKDLASTFIFHIEACKDAEYALMAIEKIRSYGKSAGIAIEPATRADLLYNYLHLIDIVLVMSVSTGYAGQSFIDVGEKIKTLVKIREGKRLLYEIEVDGGINNKTIEIVRAAGCDAVNSASYILKNNFSEAVRVLKYGGN